MDACSNRHQTAQSVGSARLVCFRRKCQHHLTLRHGRIKNKVKRNNNSTFHGQDYRHHAQTLILRLTGMPLKVTCTASSTGRTTAPLSASSPAIRSCRVSNFCRTTPFISFLTCLKQIITPEMVKENPSSILGLDIMLQIVHLLWLSWNRQSSSRIDGEP